MTRGLDCSHPPATKLRRVTFKKNASTRFACLFGQDFPVSDTRQPVPTLRGDTWSTVVCEGCIHCPFRGRYTSSACVDASHLLLCRLSSRCSPRLHMYHSRLPGPVRAIPVTDRRLRRLTCGLYRPKTRGSSRHRRTASIEGRV